MFFIFELLFKSFFVFSLKICSSHRSISLHESMPPPRDSVTHWPINWQSALIPSSSQELFFLVPVLVCRRSESHEPAAQTELSHITVTDSTWNPIAEEHATASFIQAFYKPRTNIWTSDIKGILSHPHSFTPATIINLSLLCCLKEVLLFICVTK